MFCLVPAQNLRKYCEKISLCASFVSLNTLKYNPRRVRGLYDYKPLAYFFFLREVVRFREVAFFLLVARFFGAAFFAVRRLFAGIGIKVKCIFLRTVSTLFEKYSLFDSFIHF